MQQVNDVLALSRGSEQVFFEGLPPQEISVAWLQVATTAPDGVTEVLATELAVLERGVWHQAIDWRAQTFSRPVAGVIRGWAFYAIPGQEQEPRSISQRDRSLALCIQKLAWLVRLKNPDSDASKGAINLLRRYGLLGSPLRAKEAEATHG